MDQDRVVLRETRAALGSSQDLRISSDQQMDCAECYETHEVGQELVVSGCDTAEVFELVEQPLDGIAFLVEFPVTGMGPAPVVARRDDRYRAGLKNGVVKVFGIVGTVGDDMTWLVAFDQRFGEQHLTPVAWAGNKTQRITKAVTCGVKLGC